MPKFLLMVNHNNGVFDDKPMDEWEPEEVKAHMDYYEVLNRELTKNGELVQFMALADARLARIVHSDGTFGAGRDRRSVPGVQGGACRVPGR
jgi:hypothetical protein